MGLALRNIYILPMSSSFAILRPNPPSAYGTAYGTDRQAFRKMNLFQWLICVNWRIKLRRTGPGRRPPPPPAERHQLQEQPQSASGVGIAFPGGRTLRGWGKGGWGESSISPEPRTHPRACFWGAFAVPPRSRFSLNRSAEPLPSLFRFFRSVGEVLGGGGTYLMTTSLSHFLGWLAGFCRFIHNGGAPRLLRSNRSVKCGEAISGDRLAPVVKLASEKQESSSKLSIDSFGIDSFG